METSEAIDLLRPAIPGGGGTWADFGAGSGTFTLALASLLGSSGHVFAIDRDPRAVVALRRLETTPTAARVTAVQRDLAEPLLLPGLGVDPEGALDGVLAANTLHFVPEPSAALRRLVALLRPGGRLVLIEYDRRPASPWVPYPIDAARLPALANEAGLDAPSVVGRRASIYGGDLYVAVADRR